MEIIGHISFDKGLYLNTNCLNQIVGIKIGKFEGKITTPKLPVGYQDDKESIGGKSLLEGGDISYFIDSFDWGRTTNWYSENVYVNSFKVEVILNNFEITDTIKDELLFETVKWKERFINNLFGFGYIYSRYQKFDKFDDGFYYYRREKEDEKFKRFIEPKIILKGSSGRNNLSIEALKKLLDLTSNNKILKKEYKLLKEAQRAIYAEDYRQAVLDSATSLEICLANMLKNNLNIIDNNLRDTILRKYGSISEKRKLLKTLNIQLPLSNNDYQEGIEALRNRAIHAGHLPNSSEAKKAYKVASDTIQTLILDKFE